MKLAHGIPDAVLRSWEVVIIGAGVAGTLAALHLARAGVDVLLVDRARFPRYKVCGCCLSLRAWRLLAEAGLGEAVARAGALPLRDFQIHSKTNRALIPLPGGWVLSRERLDSILAEAACDAGATFINGVRAECDQIGPEGVRIRLINPLGSETVEAQSVICADGLQGSFLRSPQVAPARVSRRARVGAGCLVDDAPKTYQPGTIYMACGAAGYAGAVLLEDQRLNIAAALDVDAVRAHGPARAVGQLLASARLPVPGDIEQAAWKGTPALTRRRLPGPRRMFFVGDAAGYVEPITGEGIAWAIEGGKVVAEHVKRLLRGASGQEAQWNAAWRQIVGRHQWPCRVMSQILRHPRLVQGALGLVAVRPGLLNPLLRHINAEPRELHT